ncbi:MAG TPA: type IV pilin [Methanomassiliicoccales archaeon]|nr:type IV pilin [Methanomassiliicoccales archaeon]
MKKMWKLNNKAVSPVIATILMVAITVVLAAVLYVMVMGFGSGGGDETPSGSLTYTTTATGYRISIASISENDISNTSVVWLINGVEFDDDTNITWAGSTGYVTAGSYIDVTTDDLDAGTINTIALLYLETNNNIASLNINVPA